MLEKETEKLALNITWGKTKMMTNQHMDKEILETMIIDTKEIDITYSYIQTIVFTKNDIKTDLPS